MPSHFHKKFRWGTTFATGLKRFTDPVTKLRMKHTNSTVRIPKDGEISKFPGYHSSEEEEEPSEKPKPYDLYGFGENEPLGYKASDKEVELDLESTARSKPKCKKLKKTAKSIPNHTFCDCLYCPKNMVRTMRLNPTPEHNPEPNPDIATIIAQQLQNILPQIVTQVTANVNNVNGGNGNGGSDGCSYKTFTACNPKEFDVQARGREAEIAMSWNDFKALLVEEFCPSNEMEKLDNEF
ncbi:hypothetical protein Tco_0613534 [Tanacetum coccineum]